MNIFPIVVTAVVTFIIGFLWYGPVFGKIWLQLKEIPQTKVDAMRAKGMGPMVPRMFGALVINLITVLVMQFMLTSFAIVTIVPAALLAGLLWLGFIATTLFSAVLWEERKLALYTFDAVYYLVNLKMIAVLLVVLS